MIKFDSDFAIFGTIAGKIADATEGGIITYANSAFVNIYGDYRGKSILNLLSEIGGNNQKGLKLYKQLRSKNFLMAEGMLNKRLVKCHIKIVNIEAVACFQAALTDLTELNLIKSLYFNTAEALKRAAKAADEDTGLHVTRINHYSQHIAELLNKEKKFIEEISKYAQLHDIGKIKVAELIKLPRKLTADEYSEVKKHAIYGAEIVAGLDGLNVAYNIAIDHHEKWDGSGYPNGKKGKDISLEGRIVALADVFDALVSERPYKPAFDYNKSKQIISMGDNRVSPQHFDPEILGVFVANYDDFVDLHKKLKD